MLVLLLMLLLLLLKTMFPTKMLPTKTTGVDVFSFHDRGSLLLFCLVGLQNYKTQPLQPLQSNLSLLFNHPLVYY
jgi:hypothetical protein